MTVAPHAPGRLNIVACGLFHYGRYAPAMAELGVLAGFYFSHRRSTRFSLAAPASSHNLYAKEYLLGLHLKLLQDRGLDVGLRLYHRVWQRDLARAFTPARANLFLLHGNCLETMRHCREQGAMVIAEAVNQHPTSLAQLLAAEAASLGLAHRTEVHAADRMLRELDATDLLLAPSEAVARSFEARGFERRRIRVLPYGTATPPSAPQRSRIADAPDTPRNGPILVVGHVALRKGHHLLIRALKRLAPAPRGAVSLRFVGRVEPAYFAALRKLGIAFEHESHVEHARLVHEMATARMLVLPSLEDGFGMVVSEAMSVGTPVLVSQYAGASAHVDAFGGGCVVDPHDTDAFAAALERLLDRPASVPPSSPLPSWRDYAASLAELVDREIQPPAGARHDA